MAWDIFTDCIGFDWDSGNVNKNWIKHQVTPSECEETFFNQPLVIRPDVKHSDSESRYYLLGRTNTGRELFLVFTLRRKKIRVISARDMSKKERREYEKKKITKI